MGRSLWVPLLVALITLTACTSAGQGPTRQAPPVAESGQPSTPRTLTFGLNGEPKVLGGMMALGNESNRWGDVQWALHQRLTFYNERGEVRPQIATGVPSQSDGSWVLRPDGTMQTTYQLRPGVTWHDGMSLTAKDFVFAWTLVNDRELPISSRPVASQVTT